MRRLWWIVGALVCVLIIALTLAYLASGPVIVTYDKEMADRLISLAERGSIEACLCLDHIYYDYHPEKGLKWLRRAANSGDPRVQFAIYSNIFGSSLPWRRRESLEMLKKAAEAGLPRAENELGYCYDWGRLVEPNTRTAEHWYRKSAMHGFEPGIVSLSFLLYKTRSDKAGLIEAYAWNRAAGGPPSLKKVREDIIGKAVALGYERSDIIAQGESRAAEYSKRIVAFVSTK